MSTQNEIPETPNHILLAGVLCALTNQLALHQKPLGLKEVTAELKTGLSHDSAYALAKAWAHEAINLDDTPDDILRRFAVSLRPFLDRQQPCALTGELARQISDALPDHQHLIWQGYIPDPHQWQAYATSFAVMTQVVGLQTLVQNIDAPMSA